MKEWSENAARWMKTLGGFRPATHSAYIEGDAYDYKKGEAYTIYWNASHLRAIAAACLEVAESLEEKENE